MPNIVIPDTTKPIVDDRGKMQQQFRRWTNQVTNLDMIIGTGTPEGNIEASQGRFYMDDAGASGSILYIKRDKDIAGDTKKGWIAV